MTLPFDTILRICEDAVSEHLEVTTGPRGETQAFCTCPGRDCHTKGSGPRDCRLIFIDDGTVRLKCFHQSCTAAREAVIMDIYRRIAAARKEGGYTAAAPAKRAAAPPPKKAVWLKEWAAAIADRCPVQPTISWLAAVSPEPIPPEPRKWPRLLLDTLFEPGEHVLLFTKFASQGQYLYTIGGEIVAAAARPGQEHRRFRGFPRDTPEGAWYLAAPVTGDWTEKPTYGKSDSPGYTRRSAANCTRFPFVIVESDCMAPSAWLRILVQMRYPIAAVYTSGGKSVHSVIRIDALPHSGGSVPTTPEGYHRLVYGDGTRANPGIKNFLINLGADPAAIRPVQLSRLPGFIRGEKVETRGVRALQRLLYLNPHPVQGMPILCRACAHRDKRATLGAPCDSCGCCKHYKPIIQS